MTPALEKLIAALRNELQQYGELLALLDHQQDSVINRQADEMYAATVAIQNQSHIMQATRRERELCQKTLARELAVTETSTFVELLPLLPADYRPLVKSLVDENNALLDRVRHRARQNHLVLSRSVDLMQRFLSTIFPSRDAQVYNEHGNKDLRVTPTPPLYEAVG